MKRLVRNEENKFYEALHIDNDEDAVIFRRDLEDIGAQMEESENVIHSTLLEKLKMWSVEQK